MTHTQFDSVQQKELNQRAAARIGWTIANDSFLSADAVETFHRQGFGHYVKNGNPILSTDPGIALMPLNAAFLGQADRASLIDRLPGALRIDLSGTARLQIGTIVGAVVDEATNKPVSALTFTLPPQPQKVVAQVVMSTEALRSFGAATQGITSVLVSAVAAATDTALVATLTTHGTSIATPTPSALLAEIADARVPILLGGLGSLLALPAGTLRDLQAIGVTVLHAPAAAGWLIALDGGGLLIADDGLEMATARHASLGDDTEHFNLWQRNMAAIRCERWLRFAVRSGACAYASTGSPAL